MSAFKSFMQKYLYSDKLPLQARVVNLVLLTGMATALAFLLLRTVFGFNIQIILLSAFSFVGVGILFVIANRTQHFTVIRWITVIIITDVVWPLLFFIAGGVDSGIAAFFVLSTVIIFLLIRGKWLPVMLAIHFILVITVFAVGYFYPESVIPLSQELQIADQVISFLVVGLCIGFILIYKDRLFANENIKVQQVNANLEKSNAEVAKQDRLLAANNEAAQLLLTASYDEFGSNIQRAMRYIGESLGLARMYVWKNVKGSQGKRFGRSYGWSSPRAQSEVEPEGVAYDYDQYIPRWHELFLKNEVVNCTIDTLQTGGHGHIMSADIKSILAVPVYNKDTFWGFVSYDNYDEEHIFSQDTVAILRSCSLMLANAMIKADLDKEREDALEQALQASRAKGSFLSNMSHEMRTPMNAIIGMTSIGLSAETMERKDYAFERIDNASKHLLGVINDVLDMSKIEAGKLELAPEEFNMSKMLDSVIDVMNFRIEEKHLNLKLVQSASIPPLLIGDDQRLSQVVANLLSNAIKFSGDGGDLLLETQLVRQQGDEVEIRVSVKDNGIGISEEQQKRLFRSFEQAESGTSRKFGGTGLGLAISKSIVELMKGQIWVESKPGEGSTFSFTVVMKLARGSVGYGDDLFLPGLGGSGELPGVGTGKKDDFTGHRILLAEDVDINQEIVKALLGPTGVEIEVANNGREAYEMFSIDPRRYDMIFMDVQMPEMDGLEATRQIRALDTNWAQQIPIVAMTANVFKEDVESCLAAGMNDHIGKPLNYDDVIEKLQESLSL